MHAGADDLFKPVLNMHNLVKQAGLIYIIEQNNSSNNLPNFFIHPLELADETTKGIVNSLGSALVTHAFPNFIKFAHQRRG